MQQRAREYVYAYIINNFIIKCIHQKIFKADTRTSSLFAPIVQLVGHEGEIFCCKFSPDGNILATAGFDRKILLWNVYGECENWSTLLGHSGAIVDLKFNYDGR